MIWVTVRGFHSIKNNKPFLNPNVYGKTDEERTKSDPWLGLKRFLDQRPEHGGMDMTVTMMSPGQSRLSSARAHGAARVGLYGVAPPQRVLVEDLALPLLWALA